MQGDRQHSHGQAVHRLWYVVCAIIAISGAVVIARFFNAEKRRSRGVECEGIEVIADPLETELPAE